VKYCALILVCFFALGANSLPAQDALRGPDGGTTTRVSGVELLAIPGVPFSGKSNIEWTRTLEDGSQVTVHLEANLARDSRGRIYRERRAFVPANSDQPSRLEQIHIYDPVTRSQFLCTLITYRCVRTSYSPQTFFNAKPVGWNANNTRYLAREELGSDVIDGQSVIGTRETTTTSAGALGNDHPLVSTREFWYSAELQTNLAVTRDDPREGKQVIRLKGLSVSEPNPELFKVPIGYTVVDERVPTHDSSLGLGRPSASHMQ
jgi:hypothetical protein